MRLSLTLILSPPYDLVLWTDGSVCFLFGKDGSGVLNNCSLCGTEATLFQQAQYPQVFLLKPATFCKLFAGLGSSNKSSISLLLLSDFRSVLSSSFPFTSSSLANVARTVFTSSCSIRLQWVLGHSFLPGNDAADELAKRGALLVPSAIPCSLSALISRIHFCFLRSGAVLSHRNSLTHRIPRFPWRNSCSLPHHARCVLARLCCIGHSLLLSSYLSRIGRIEYPSCSACGHLFQDTSHLILHCPASDSLHHSLFVSLRPLVQTLGSLPASGAPWFSAMPPFLGRGRVTTKTTARAIEAYCTPSIITEQSLLL